MRRQPPARTASIGLLTLVLLVSPPLAYATLAFSAFRDGAWRIYIQRSAGDVPQRVSPNEYGDSAAPTLRADGNAVAFEVLDQGIALCELQSSPPSCRVIEVLGKSAVRPTWSQAGSELIAAVLETNAKGEDSELRVTTNALTRRAALVNQTGLQDYPDVSRDGAKVVYTSSVVTNVRRGAPHVIQTLWLANLGRGASSQILMGNAQDVHPAWSPAGDRIAFASTRSGQFEIWLVRPDGSGLHQLTSGQGAKTWPTWDPDGQSLLFAKLVEGRQSFGMVSVDGKDLGEFFPFGTSDKTEVRDPDWR